MLRTSVTGASEFPGAIDEQFCGAGTPAKRELSQAIAAGSQSGTDVTWLVRSYCWYCTFVPCAHHCRARLRTSAATMTPSPLPASKAGRALQNSVGALTHEHRDGRRRPATQVDLVGDLHECRDLLWRLA